MFRKEQQLAERSRTLLKNREVKKLKQDILEQFSRISEDELNQILPNKAQVLSIKLATRTLVYVLQDGPTQITPIFFDIEGRGNIYPTVYTLWLFPHFMEPVCVHAPVSEFIFNGADLMLPGTVGELSPVRQGDKRCIIARGNPMPFAIGEMLIDDAYLSQQGRRGKGMRVVHSSGDLLWALGNRAMPEGFGLTGVSPVATAAATAPISAEAEGMHAASDEAECTAVGGVDREMEGQLGEDTSERPSDEEHVLEELEEEVESMVLDVKPEAEISTEAEVEATEEEGQDTTTEGESAAMDQLMTTTFLRAVKYVVKDRQLPMLASTFYASYMLPSRPEGCVIDVKRSSFKKVTAFLEAMQRLRLVTLQNNSGVVSLTAVNRSAPDYRACKADDAEAIREAVEEAHGGGKKEEGPQGYRIFDLFKLSKPMRDLFGDCQGEHGEYLTAQEAKSIIMSYVNNNNLEVPDNKRLVRIDDVLRDLIFRKKKGGSKLERRAAEREQRRQLEDADFPPLGTEDNEESQERSSVDETITKEELMTAFMEKLSRYHAIESNAFPEGIRINSGSVPTIDLLLEARQGNKTVTKVTGLEAFGINPEQFAKECQKRFACSAAANQISGQRNKEVVVQGHLAREMEEWLPAKYGLPARLITATVRKGVKPKKKAR